MIVAALVFGLLIGRISAGDDDTDRPADRPATPQAVVPGPGPTRERDGVPVGYSRTEQGAAAALLNHSVVLARLVLESPDEREAALRVMGTDAFVDRTSEQLSRARRAGEAGPLGAALRGEGMAAYRGGPLGYRVVRFSREEAVIEMWAFGLVATSSGLDPQMTFQTSTNTIVSEDGDWKLASSDSRPGPTPAVDSDQPISGRQFVDGVGRLKELRYAP